MKESFWDQGGGGHICGILLYILYKLEKMTFTKIVIIVKKKKKSVDEKKAYCGGHPVIQAVEAKNTWTLLQNQKSVISIHYELR